jgi:hypothetical protein
VIKPEIGQTIRNIYGASVYTCFKEYTDEEWQLLLDAGWYIDSGAGPPEVPPPVSPPTTTVPPGTPGVPGPVQVSGAGCLLPIISVLVAVAAIALLIVLL